jgi:hypothetical protein
MLLRLIASISWFNSSAPGSLIFLRAESSLTTGARIMSIEIF